jgi:hypothetical protein
MTTSNLGRTEKTNENPPKFSAYCDLNYEDYKALFGLDGKPLEITLWRRDKKGECTKTSAGLAKGYRGRIYLFENVPAIGADKQKQCRIDVIFEDVSEWKLNSMTIEPDDFTITEILTGLNPMGVNIEVVTAYTGGAGTGIVVVKATKRGMPSSPVTNMTTTAEWDVLSAKADLDVDVTTVGATSAATGVYSLTIKKDASGTPANLTDDVKIRARKAADSFCTYISQPLDIVV